METKTSFIASTQGNWAIPDNTPAGVIVPIQMDVKVVIESIKVHVSIEHPFVGDLQVNINAPSGKSVTLHNRGGFSNDNIEKTFEGGVLNTFIGEEINGEWQLQAIDFATRDDGFIKSWSIEAQCGLIYPNETPTETETVETLVEAETVETPVEAERVETLVEAETVETLVEAETVEVPVVAETVETAVVAETVAADIDATAEGITVEAATETNETIASEIATDDLKKIEGIGPKIEELLNNAGILTFAQLADTETEKLQEILDAAGPAYNRHDPETWAEQAEMAADDEWDELLAWQEELVGGRVVEE